MNRVEVLQRDICCSVSDLTILPCSGKMKPIEDPRIQDRIDKYGLPSPYDLRDHFGFGKVSPIFRPTNLSGNIKYFAFAASVRNKSKVDVLEEIGKQIGAITRENDEIRIIEAPFLGCGQGGLHPREAMTALARGFLACSHPDALLQLCSDNALGVTIASAAIEELFRATECTHDPKKRIGSKVFQWDIAVSFAGEQRGFVEEVCSQLKSNGVSVFYDNDQQVDLWGKNLYDYLYEVYSKKSRFCVVFVSDEYKDKEWTNHERQAAQERAFQEMGNEYLLPIKFKGAKLKSLPSTIGYVDAELGVERIVELLLRKIQRSLNS